MNIVVGPIPLTSPLKLQLPVLLRTGRTFQWMDGWMDDGVVVVVDLAVCSY